MLKHLRQLLTQTEQSNNSFNKQLIYCEGKHICFSGTQQGKTNLVEWKGDTSKWNVDLNTDK